MLWTVDGTYERRCRGCDVMYYCSEACEAAHATGGHARICGLVRRLAAHKADEHTKSLMLLGLVSLLRATDSGGGSGGTGTDGDSAADASASPNGGSVPLVPTYADMQRLQSHFDDWSADEIADWRSVPHAGHPF